MRIVLIALFIQIFNSQVVLADETLLLRLHGSNTIGAELGPELVKSWLNAKGYTGIHSERLHGEEVKIVAIDKSGRKKSVEIHSHGSSTGFKSLKDGDADIAMSSRLIKKKEIDFLAHFNDMTSDSAEYVVGLDGIAVIVNRENTLNKLDKEMIKKIFTGEVKKWSEIDKKLSGKINVYARDNKSGTFDTFKSLVFGKKASLVKKAKRYESNAKLSDDVAKDVQGIGFVGLPYVRLAKALAIAEKGTVAKIPESFDVATEDYTLSRRLYLYVAEIKSNKHIKSFVNFALSYSGQEVVEQTGFISQNPRSKAIVLHKGFPEEYLDFTKQSERLSINFRFKKGSTKLDNKSKRDVKRLVDFIARPENKSKKVMLFGFSESSETLPVFALDLSEYRVDWVSNLLVKNGIDPVRVRGYGDSIPVVSNEDAGGRHKNRRVEVWLR